MILLKPGLRWLLLLVRHMRDLCPEDCFYLSIPQHPYSVSVCFVLLLFLDLKAIIKYISSIKLGVHSILYQHHIGYFPLFVFFFYVLVLPNIEILFVAFLRFRSTHCTNLKGIATVKYLTH